MAGDKTVIPRRLVQSETRPEPRQEPSLSPSQHTTRQPVRAAAAAFIGTMIEWYDFYIYATAAALVFGELYFPSHDPFVSTMASFATFAVGFFARPLGGLIFGHLGDKIGRKKALMTTLMMMGVATVCVGLLPSYTKVGLLAPVLLVLLRVVQGVAVGGEWGGAVLMALEYSGRGRRGFFASFPQAGVPLGLLTSTAVMALCQTLLAPEDFLAWGWRIPFFLSGLLIVVGLLIRLRILESPLFEALREQNKIAEAPLRETLRDHWREIVLAGGARVVENACFYLFAIWVVDYGTRVLNVKESWMYLAVASAAVIEVFTIPLFGMMSDRLQRRRTYMAGCLFLMLFAMPYFALLETRQPVCILLAVVVSLAVGHAWLYSVQASLIPELFATRVRCTGASIGYQLASPFSGGVAPIVATVLIRDYPGEYWPLAAYIILMGALSLLCVQRLAETSRKDIT
jgi:MFS transporter, MHS family, shikimate and dehydroshikimate transport protein